MIKRKKFIVISSQKEKFHLMIINICINKTIHLKLFVKIKRKSHPKELKVVNNNLT
jgi:hypothetical protein